MCNTTYEGHKNYETWNVALWLNNEEPLYRMVNGWHADNASELANMIHEYVEEGATFITDRGGIYSDLITTALQAVDWEEVADTFRPDEGWPDEQEEEDDESDSDEDDSDLDPFLAIVYNGEPMTPERQRLLDTWFDHSSNTMDNDYWFQYDWNVYPFGQ